MSSKTTGRQWLCFGADRKQNLNKLRLTKHCNTASVFYGIDSQTYLNSVPGEGSKFFVAHALTVTHASVFVDFLCGFHENALAGTAARFNFPNLIFCFYDVGNMDDIAIT